MALDDLGNTPFTNLTGATSPALSVTAAAADDGTLFRAVFTNGCGSLATLAATLTVRVTPTITWPTPAAITFGTALGPAQLNARADDPQAGRAISGTFAYTPPSGTVLNAGAGQTLTTVFTPTDPRYTTATAAVLITVARASQTIAFAPLAARMFGDPAFNATATATSGLPVAFTATGGCTVAGTLVTSTFAIACLPSQLPFALQRAGGTVIVATLAFTGQTPAGPVR